MDRVWVRCDEAMYGDEWPFTAEFADEEPGEFEALAELVAEAIWDAIPASHRGGPITIVVQETKDGREMARVRVWKVARTEYRTELVSDPRKGHDDQDMGPRP